MQHQIDLAAVHAPAASLEEARRRAQRGTPLTALLRAYRLGHTCFSDWVFQELARQSAGRRDDHRRHDGACPRSWPGTSTRPPRRSSRPMPGSGRTGCGTAAPPGPPGSVSCCRASGSTSSATEATLGYRLRQYHVGVVCWTGDEASSLDNITRLERAIGHVAAQSASGADPLFLPRDESSAWAWLPLGIRDRFDAAAASAAAWTATSMSRSATRSRAPPGSASPTSRPSPPRGPPLPADPRRAR